MRLCLFLCAVLLALPAHAVKARLTSVYLSEHFLNELIQSHVKPGLLRDLKIELDTDKKQIDLRGIVQIPVEELRAIDLDPSLSAYRFQVTIKPQATDEGYLILEFPLTETYFYPLSSRHPERDRVVIPVQLLSVALASARGYFAALSGDFSGFDRKSAKLKALLRDTKRAMRTEKNPDALDALKTEKESLRLQIEAIPIERKQFETLAKEYGKMLRFTGEKEINLNDAFAARQNALIIKLNLAGFTPFLSGVSLGGVRIIHDKRDGENGENYFAIDISTDMNVQTKGAFEARPANLDGLKIAPAAMIRINQALLESEMVASSEKKAMGSKLTDLKIDLKEDGLHVSGRYHKFFFTVPFDTVVDFNTPTNVDDAFDVSVRNINIAGLDLRFLSGFILETIKSRLDGSLKGICTFEYIGEQEDHSRALRVHVSPAKLIPALPGMHLVDVEVRDRQFLLKVGRL